MAGAEDHKLTARASGMRGGSSGDALRLRGETDKRITGARSRDEETARFAQELPPLAKREPPLFGDSDRAQRLV